MDVHRTIPEMIMHAGYAFEAHKVMTDDQYINTAWRITGKLGHKNALNPGRKPPVILQHGLADNGAGWLVPNSSRALPYMLSDAGYDVWLTNARGNVYSYEHMDIEGHDAKKRYSDFYKFTFDEMAKYDTPAYLDYILDRSSFEKVFYIGVSQGTTTFLAA